MLCRKFELIPTSFFQVMAIKNYANPFTFFFILLQQSQRSDELDIQTDEELDVIEWDDGDGWCKGRNKNSQEGYFPQSYVQAISRPTTPPKVGGASNETAFKLVVNEEGD